MRAIDVSVTRARWSTTIQVSATLDFWGRISVTYVSFNCISAQFVMKELSKSVKSVQLSYVVLMSANNISVTLAKQRRILNSNLLVSSARRHTALRRVLTLRTSVSPKVTSCVTSTQIRKTRLKRQSTWTLPWSYTRKTVKVWLGLWRRSCPGSIERKSCWMITMHGKNYRILSKRARGQKLPQRSVNWNVWPNRWSTRILKIFCPKFLRSSWLTTN